jgi:RND superfamily putative drug exporter
MASAEQKAPPPRNARESPLGWLGHRVARHPWSVLILWIAIVVVCLYPATQLGSAITNSFANPLPSSDQSILADNELAKEFPSQQDSPSSAVILLESTNIVGPVGKNATLALTAALAADPNLRNVSSVESLYVAYSAYLAGEVELGWGFLGAALNATPSLPVTVNQTATLVWAPVATYLNIWQGIVATLPSGTPPSAADWPAYNQTRAEFASSPVESQVLFSFYNGTGGSGTGFNASISNDCYPTQTAVACADEAARSTLSTALPQILPSAAVAPAELMLSDLNVENWTTPSAQRVVATTLLGGEVGVSPAWLLTLWNTFPAGAPSEADIGTWVQAQVQQDPIDGLPLPIPSQIYSSFVNRAASATLVIVSFNVGDEYQANGSSVTFSDVTEINHVISHVLGGSSGYGSVTSYVTGDAPLDSATTYLATSAIGLLLVLTVIVLLVIMIIYFRSPSAPLLSFGMIGIALVVCLAFMLLVGLFIMKFFPEIESIILVFLMAIGTDYSVFLLARYREELVRGTPPTKAVEVTVRWAGQSIATSGLAVMVVAVALTLSNISFLEQIGLCILIAVGGALIVNLTVLPAILALVGPKIFWPNSGERFARYAERRRTSIETHRDPIDRAGRFATRRPLAVIGVILLLSIPVVIVALNVPVSYDITNIGLPPSNSAQLGFTQLSNEFGASYTSGSYVLVTFEAPVVSGGVPNAQEFRDIAGLAQTMNATPGVASVSTLVGEAGAPLAAWLNFSSLPPAEQIALNQTKSTYVGLDGATVLFNFQTNESGYSGSAISVLNGLESRVGSFDASHPEIVQALYGGAASTTQDIKTMVNHATENMLTGAAIGLILLMILILGSAFVPILALAVIGLSILWSWAATYFVVGILEGEVLIFLLPMILLILVLGLGMDYNVLLLTRVKEERTRGNRGTDAIRDAVTYAGGVITAAAVILGGAFLLLGLTSPLGIIAALGLGIGSAVLLQAFVAQLFFTPAVLTLGKDRIWKGWQRSR